MVEVPLKHVHRIRAGEKEYHYAWRGGPRLPGAPGSAEYLDAYREAHRRRKAPHSGDMRALITAYKASPEFDAKSDHTKRAYRAYLDLIDAAFGDLPFAAVDDADVADDFYAWRDGMAATPRKADYAVSTLKRLLEWGKKRRRFNRENHAEGIERLHSANRSESIWSEGDFAKFRAVASRELLWAVELAAHTGIRQGDLIALPWGAYDGESIQLRTSKSGRHVTVPCTQACRDLLAGIDKRQVVILTTERGKRRWTADGLRSSFGKACKAAKVGRTFHDLRRTAATRMLSAGFDASQIALVMGWAEDDVDALKRRYVSRSAVVRQMLAKLGEEG